MTKAAATRITETAATRQQKEQEAKEDAIYQIGYKHGVYNGDEDAIRERLEQNQVTAESLNEAYYQSAAHMDTAVKVTEGTKKVADVVADVVATADKTGIFKDVYSALSQIRTKVMIPLVLQLSFFFFFFLHTVLCHKAFRLRDEKE